MKNPVRWFEIYVDDLPRARRFYEAVLKVKLERMTAPEPTGEPMIELWAFPADMAGPGCSGALVKMAGFSARAGGTIVYFGSDDCSIEEKRILKAGGKVQKPKMSIGDYGFISLGVDTEGNIFGIHSMK